MKSNSEDTSMDHFHSCHSYFPFHHLKLGARPSLLELVQDPPDQSRDSLSSQIHSSLHKNYLKVTSFF